MDTEKIEFPLNISAAEYATVRVFSVFQEHYGRELAIHLMQRGPYPMPVERIDAILAEKENA